MRRLLTLVAGVLLPIALVVLFVRGLAPRPSDPPPPPELDDAVATDLQVGQPDGVWELDDSRSFVGYRIGERWVRTAEDREGVGRTDSVTGRMVIEDATLTELEVVAQVDDLTSDSDRRDRAIRARYLESRWYPEARFVSSGPVSISQITPGEPYRTVVEGELTLHGVTRAISIDALSRWVDDEVEVVATVPITLADYEIRPPALPGFVFVADTGDIELELRFVR